MNFNLDNINEYLSNNERFLRAGLLLKMNKVAEKNNDQTLFSITSILDKKSDMFVTRAELNDLYKKFYSPNTKFATFFSEELGVIDNKTAPSIKKNNHELNISLPKENYILKNNLTSLFNDKAPLKQFSEKHADNAEKMCLYSLQKKNLPIKSAIACAGNDNLIICHAEFETPKGKTSIAVPIKFTNNQPEEPVTFIKEKDVIEKLNRDNVISYLKLNAGKNPNVDYKKLITASENKTEILFKPLSNVEKAVIELQAEEKKQKLNKTANLLIKDLDKQNEPLNYVNISVENNKFASLTEQYASKLGQAELKFGKQLIADSLTFLHNFMKNAKLPCHIKLQNFKDDIIDFTVTLPNRTAFSVPITIKNNKLEYPNILISNAKILDFSEENISKIATDNFDKDIKLWATTHPSNNLSSDELLEMAKTASSTEIIEEIVHILSTRQDTEHYKLANQLLIKSITKQASSSTIKPISKCSAPIKKSNSIKTYCSHTYRPINEVYQDEFGHCIAMYHKFIPKSEGI